MYVIVSSCPLLFTESRIQKGHFSVSRGVALAFLVVCLLWDLAGTGGKEAEAHT